MLQDPMPSRTDTGVITQAMRDGLIATVRTMGAVELAALYVAVIRHGSAGVQAGETLAQHQTLSRQG